MEETRISSGFETVRALTPISRAYGQPQIRGVDSALVDGPTAVMPTTMMCDGNHSMVSENNIMFRPMF